MLLRQSPFSISYTLVSTVYSSKIGVHYATASSLAAILADLPGWDRAVPWLVQFHQYQQRQRQQESQYQVSVDENKIEADAEAVKEEVAQEVRNSKPIPSKVGGDGF